MYLHIGKDFVLKLSNIIGIFDIESLKETKSYDNILKKIKYIEDISDGNKKTLILTKEEDKIKAYITNISSTTLATRNK